MVVSGSSAHAGAHKSEHTADGDLLKDLLDVM